MPPYVRVLSRSNEDKTIEYELLMILQNLHEKNKMLEAIKRNIEEIRKISNSLSRSIKLIEDLFDHTYPHLYPISKNGVTISIGSIP